MTDRHAIKHVSFDVWNTLISPNPEFAKARDVLLEEFFDLPQSEVRAAYKEIKTSLDAQAEATGAGRLAIESYELLNARLGGVLHTGMVYALKLQMERQFVAHPPIVLQSTIDALDALADSGVTLSIASNTNFICGDTLEEAALDRFPGFRFHIYSTFEKVSKPHPEFFKLVADSISGFSMGQRTAADAIHVGDNKICDGGSEQAGIRFVYVTGPADLPAVLAKEGLL